MVEIFFIGSSFTAIISATTCTSGGSGTTLCTGTIVATASGGSSSYTYQVVDTFGVLQNPLALCIGYYSVTVTDTVYGCTDSISDVTIGYAGCTDPLTMNYDPNATCDDGSCVACLNGCLDDGCCTDGTVNVVGTPCPNGTVPGTETWHLCPTTGVDCTTTTLSYNSPYLLYISGLTAVNLYASANRDDGSCIYRNCLDPTSGNYNYTGDAPALRLDCIGDGPTGSTIGDTSCCCYGTSPMPPYLPCCLPGNTSVPDIIFETFIEAKSWYTCATSPSGEVVNDCICPITHMDPKGISITSLVGIEGFVNLTQLVCSSNLLTSLDLTGNVFLTTLYTQYNLLTSIDISTCILLYRLDCYSNQLTSLDVSTNVVLNQFRCDSNQLTSLDVSNNVALSYFRCDSNQLTSLDVSTNVGLSTFLCNSNQLTSLDVSTNTNLSFLWCQSNQLSSLDVSSNTALTTLSCYSNQLTSLDVSNTTALTNLFCGINQLTTIDVSDSTSLNQLQCNNNNLTVINLGSGITISGFLLQATGNPGMVIKVGSAARVTLANSVFIPGTNFDVGTTITI